MKPRPWERRGIGRVVQQDKPRAAVVPHITVDNIDYKSDRFYLHGCNSHKTECICGARAPPPLLDRGRLVASLDLKAAILASYTLDVGWMVEAFPSLFDGSVPTLILHGEKAFSSLTKASSNSVHDKSAGPSVDTYSQYSNDDDGPLKKKAKTTLDDEDPPEAGWTATKRPNRSWIHNLNQSVHFTQILPTWLPPQTSCALLPNANITSNKESDLEKNKVGVDEDIIARREHKRGVHHPKYMILFEKRGSVVVLVSTGNFTRPSSIDASWMQRFEPGESPKISNSMRYDGSDFGHVLTNFLQYQSNAAAPGEMIPEVFLKQYLDMNSLDDFRQRFKFHESQVHLIATVPGDYAGRHCTKHLGKASKSRSFLYGPQRIADLASRLHQADGSTKPWLPNDVFSSQDRFIVQATSIGAHWNGKNFPQLTRSYFGQDDLQQRSRSDNDLLERTDILWPTQQYIRQASRQSKDKADARTSPSSVASALETDAISTSFLFLSSKTFNSIDLQCLSRMTMYESSYPPQVQHVAPPHIKTFARMFEGDECKLRRRYGVGKAQECFSWVMLTSACLSRGAQGTPVPDRAFDSDAMTYSNFELGVLFCSRLQRQANDRLYCWNPNQCTCKRNNEKGATMIHLPIPYCLRPRPYQNDPDVAHMCETPYFHEIEEGTGFVGQMALTPLGASLAASRR